MVSGSNSGWPVIAYGSSSWAPDVTPFLVIDDVLEMHTWCISVIGKSITSLSPRVPLGSRDEHSYRDWPKFSIPLPEDAKHPGRQIISNIVWVRSGVLGAFRCKACR